MNKQDWQLKIPLDAILFDCDGTLTSIEGIDELALLAGPEKSQAVQAMTAEAMGATGINPDLYQQRLALVCPTMTQMDTLAESYFTHCTPDAKLVISLLQQLGKSIYVLSAGLTPAVSSFATRLHIPLQNIFAVNVEFDTAGNYVDFDHASPLIHNHGKRQIVEQLKKHHQHTLYIGDGLNDIAVRDLVTRFVGYGGAYYRKNIAELCDFYITKPSLLPLLPLALTGDEIKKLSAQEWKWYEDGVKLL